MQRMKLNVFCFLSLALLPATLCAQLSFGSATLLNRDWRFVLADDPQAREPRYDDAAWQRVILPHDWSVRGQLDPELASCTGYLPGGIGWYRKTLAIPTVKGGERVYLYFEGVYNRSEVYLNGHLLGARPNGYVSFYYDATPYVRFDEANVLAVRVDHSRSADSRWYTGSGIYRNVYLIRAGPVHIAPWGVFVRSSEPSDLTATVEVDTEIQNESASDAVVTVQHELFSAEGAAVAAASQRLTLRAGASGTATASLDVSSPQRWSVDHPYLYHLKTTVLQDGRPIDGTTTRTGIRTFSFDPNRGFFLNGVSMKMKGVCLHHDAGVLGAAVPREVWKTRLQTLKSIGCNAVRTSHNPQATDLYELCDELGLLVLDEAFDEWEFPKRKWLKGWNVGEPGFQGSYDFFEAWSDRDIADMVRRDRNHPSIFAWSIGNEVDYPNDPYSHPILNGSRIDQPMFGGYKPDQPDANRLGAIAQRLAAEVKKHDATRPVTAALAGVVMSNETEYPAALDITGYNYTEDRYAVDHATYPDRIIYGSENRHSMAAWKAVVENDHIFGQFLWTGIDYLGEAGPWPSRGFYSGLMDLSGAIKPRGRFREALWSSRPVAYLGTERVPKDDRKSIDAWPVWNYELGTPVRVLCYTNAAQAQLMLNGKPIGQPRPYDHETGVIAWDLTFEPGRLEVIGLNAQGTETCRSTLVSSGAPASLRVSAHQPVIARADGVAIISLQVVDEAGVQVMDSEQEVACTIDGPGRLLGLEAGNNRDMSDYTDAVHRVYRGRMVAYVQALEAGEVRVRFNTPGLPEASVTLTAE
jgi:beta-galactosidase